jgi:hypothetical protein
MTSIARVIDVESGTHGEPAVDRRSAFRMMTTLRVGKITCNGRQDLCLIRNISHGGLMLRVFADHQVGDNVTVELKSDCVVNGTVAWTRDESVGVTFAEPVDALEVLRNERGADGRLPRAPRLDMHSRARLRIGDNDWPVELRDLSQGGAKIKMQDTLAVGDEAVLIVSGLKPVKAIVRWQVGDHAGLAFIGTVPLADLVSWMNARRGIGRRPAA